MLSSIILPKKMNDVLKSIEQSDIRLNHSYDFIRFLLYKNHMLDDDITMNAFINVSSLYLKSNFTHNYNKMFMSSLIDNSIILKEPYFNSSYSSHYKGTPLEHSKPYGYRFSDDYFDFSEPVIVQFTNKQPNHGSKQINKVINDLKRLEFDTNGMMKAVMNYNIDDFIEVNDEIQEDVVDVIDTYQKTIDGNYATYTISIDKALAKAKERHLDLVMYKNHCYFDILDRFKKNRTNSFRASQFYSISTLQSEDFYASINDTNKRLDTNLTNLKSDFIKNGFVTLNGQQLIDIDLSNSQPCLLGNLFGCMENMLSKFPNLTLAYHYPPIDITMEDVKIFIHESGDGTFYDYICEHTGWSRKLAKNIFIKIMFSKAGWNSCYKKRLKELFPSVISWMDEFKLKNGEHKKFAIMLQKLESEIFIQNIYPRIRKQGYVVYTKHDSILCKVSDYDAVKSEMEKIMNEMGLKFKLK